MHYHLSSEQQALADATTGLLEACASTHRSAIVDGDTAFDAECWQRASQELGLAGVAVPEQHDGAGGTLLDAAVVLEMAGQTLSALPLWTSISAGRVLDGLAAPSLAGALLAEVAAGSVIPSLIGVQPGQVIDANATDDGHHILSGRATHVVGGTWTDQFLVIARTEDGSALFNLARSDDGVSVTVERALDPTRPLLTVTFDHTPADRLSAGSIEASSFERVRAEVGILLAAEQVGTAQGALDMAVEYGRTRQQFGRPIGSFQSLKHLLADAYVDVATARDAMRYGAWALSAGLDAPGHTSRLTRASVTPRVQRVCATNLQVHGGIGYTWEHDAHLYYKRSISTAHLMDEVDQDLDAIADAIGLGTAPS